MDAGGRATQGAVAESLSKDLIKDSLMDELAKLKWQCRRGTRELDLLLNNYLDNYFVTANLSEQRYFLEILKREDSELMAQFDQLAQRFGGTYNK